MNPDDPTHYAGTLVSIDGEEAKVTRGRPIRGDFRDPSWEPVADIERLVGSKVRIWVKGSYTARAVAGTEGQQLRDQVAQRAGEASQQLLAALELDE